MDRIFVQQLIDALPSESSKLLHYAIIRYKIRSCTSEEGRREVLGTRRVNVHLVPVLAVKISFAGSSKLLILDITQTSLAELLGDAFSVDRLAIGTVELTFDHLGAKWIDYLLNHVISVMAVLGLDPD